MLGWILFLDTNIFDNFFVGSMCCHLHQFVIHIRLHTKGSMSMVDIATSAFKHSVVYIQSRMGYVDSHI